MPLLTNVPYECNQRRLEALHRHYVQARNARAARTMQQLMACCRYRLGIQASHGHFATVTIADCNRAMSRMRGRWHMRQRMHPAVRGFGQPPGGSATKLPWCGTGIKPLQTMLKDLGYYSGRIDGDAGPGTTNAIVAAQRQFGLPTGAITKAFCGKLVSAWNAKMEAPATAPPAPGAPSNGEGGFAKTGGDVVPGEPGVPAVIGEDEGLMAKWQAMPTAYKAGIIGGGVLLLAGGGYAVYRMTR